MRQIFKVERQTGWRQTKPLGDLTGRHAFRASDNKRPEDCQSRFMSERTKRAYNKVRVHSRIIDRSIQ